MKRYELPTDKLINQLTPYYLSGRKYILFLQSLVYPLKKMNERFMEFARNKHIEARMTSQTMYFEWFLNYKFQKYFSNPLERIYIKESETVGVDIYHEDALNGRPFTVWYDNELIITSNDEEEPKEFYYLSEEKAINKVSFMVCVPFITIDMQEFVYMLSYVINTYKVAGKTYLIKIEQQEIEPNKT
ncbi:hypothetical protein [Bacteroides thetaiotaomicron]|uniref:hypothetical protein n=1 Tax=Bacteroides thetaiotaomicron TaxID=818 RepID=UPI0039C47B51